MNKKRETRKKRILLCGGAALEEGANAWQDLLNLQMLLRLKKSGFDPEGGSVWICRITCDQQDAEGIINQAEKEKCLLVMKREDAPDRILSRRFRKNKNIPQMALSLASGSRMLTYLIDRNASDFEILKDADARRMVEIFWKEEKSGQKNCREGK